MDHSKMNMTGMDHTGMEYNGMADMDHNGMTGMDHSDMTGMAGMHMMKMYFHFSAHSTILFSFWKTTSWQGMLGSCIAIFIMAALYEGLKVGREILLKLSLTNEPISVPSSDVHIVQPAHSFRTMLLSRWHVLQSVLHIVQIVISYFLMLIFMTFNMWLCIAVALGAGAGYFMFAWRRTIVADSNEHCH
ncbi:High affinity copper uptake protein 1 [Lamellibrachia satsuma]|nr:High affinity copper uptake protein 1 [Lamellibrachia satsuma]